MNVESAQNPRNSNKKLRITDLKSSPDRLYHLANVIKNSVDSAKYSKNLEYDHLNKDTQNGYKSNNLLCYLNNNSVTASNKSIFGDTSSKILSKTGHDKISNIHNAIKKRLKRNFFINQVNNNNINKSDNIDYELKRNTFYDNGKINRKNNKKNLNINGNYKNGCENTDETLNSQRVDKKIGIPVKYTYNNNFYRSDLQKRLPLLLECETYETKPNACYNENIKNMDSINDGQILLNCHSTSRQCSNETNISDDGYCHCSSNDSFGTKDKFIQTVTKTVDVNNNINKVKNLIKFKNWLKYIDIDNNP